MLLCLIRAVYCTCTYRSSLIYLLFGFNTSNIHFQSTFQYDRKLELSEGGGGGNFKILESKEYLLLNSTILE